MTAFKIFIGIITALPFIVLGFFYDSIPQTIPLFTDVFGDPTVYGAKNLITVFKIPVMALLLQIVCIIMYGNYFKDVKKDRENLVYVNRNLWITFSVFISLKMSLISLEVILIGNPTYMKYAGIVRFAELLVVIIAVIFLFYWISQLHSSIKESQVIRGKFFVFDRKRSDEFLLNVFSMNMANIKFYMLAASLLLYIFVVILPLLTL